jgi:polyhydroxyalkanoate synthesis regulator phasin
MAQGKERDRRRASAGRTDAVRSAVDQAFSVSAAQGAAAAEQGRERAQDIVDQLATAAGRVREVLDDLRPPTADDVRALAGQVAALEKRVAALEAERPAKAPPKRSTTRRASSGTSRKPKS